MDRNVKLALATAVLAVGVALAVAAVPAGTPSLAILAAALLGGVGWFFREFDREEAERRRVCQSYAAVIAIQYHFLRDVLSDEQLAHWERLAPRIARGFEPESFGEHPKEPYPLLPDARPHLHLLRPETVDLLTRWHYLDADMVSLWEDLGTRKQASLGAARIKALYDEIKRYRKEYRDCGGAALLALKGDFPGLRLQIGEHTEDIENDR